MTRIKRPGDWLAEQREAEVLEQCRINGMGAEREAALMGKVSRLEGEIEELRLIIASDTGTESAVAALQEENSRLSNLCDKWNAECDEYREENRRQDERIRALEAHNAVLIACIRDCIEDLERGFIRCRTCGDQEDTATMDVVSIMRKALASTPEQSLSSIRRAERERCAKAAESFAYMSENFNALAEEIRQMED